MIQMSPFKLSTSYEHGLAMQVYKKITAFGLLPDTPHSQRTPHALSLSLQEYFHVCIQKSQRLDLIDTSLFKNKNLLISRTSSFERINEKPPETREARYPVTLKLACNISNIN